MAGGLIEGVGEMVHGVIDSLIAVLRLPFDLLQAIFRSLVDILGRLGAVITCESLPVPLCSRDLLPSRCAESCHAKKRCLLTLDETLSTPAANLAVIAVIVVALYLLNNTRQGNKVQNKANSSIKKRT